MYEIIFFIEVSINPLLKQWPFKSIFLLNAHKLNKYKIKLIKAAIKGIEWERKSEIAKSKFKVRNKKIKETDKK